MINRTVSHYHILQELGAGAMGVVYLAEDLNLKRQVAIKFASETADRIRFLSEARLAASLNHPNIAAIYNSGEEQGMPFIVMELVKGRKFSDLLNSSELTLSRRLKIVAQIAEALAEAHRHKIIHRDIKPGNVIINEQEQVKVLDFGLAKQLKPIADEDDDLYGQTMTAQHTQAGTFLGTWHYASPEQARGFSQQADERSDVFSLGVILYECLTGERPFKGKTPLEIAAQIQLFNPPLPSQLNAGVFPRLEQITIKAMAKQPADRFQNAGEMLAELKTFLDELHLSESLNSQSLRSGISREVPAQPVQSEKPVVSPSRFRWIVLAIILLVAAGWLGSARAMKKWPFSPAKRNYAPAAERAFARGIQFLREGDYYQASVALRQAVQADGNFVLARARLAEALTEMDYNSEAREQLNEIQLLVRDRSSLPKADSFYLEAILNSVARKFPTAIRNYEELVKLASVNEKPNAHFDLGRAYEKNDEPQKAIAQFQQVIAWDQQAAVPHLRLGVLYGVRLKEQAKAEAEFNQAEKLFKDSRSLEGETEVFFQRGTMYDGLSQAQIARDQLSKAMDKSKLLTNQYQYIRALLQLSFNSLYQGQFQQAGKEAAEVLRLAKEQKMNDLATRGLITQGVISYWSGKRDKAEEYFNQAIVFADNYEGQYSRALALGNRCDMYIDQGNHLDQCLKETEEARAFFKSAGYLSEELQVLLIQARANRKKRNFEEAQKVYGAVIPLSVNLKDKYSESIARSEFGQLLLEQSRFSEALDQFNQRYELSKELGQKDRLIYALCNRAMALIKLCRPDQARQDLFDARSLLSQLKANRTEMKKEVSTVESQLASSLQCKKSSNWP